MEKWSEADMSLFLDLYQEHEVLWNPKIDLYRNNEARRSALQAILKGMNKPNLTENDLKTKIKNIRTTYNRELTRVLKAKKSGAGTDDLYVPVLIWFKKADVFLRAVAEARGSKTNMDSQIESQPKITLFSGDEDSTSAGDTESALREESSEPIQSPPAEIPNTTPKNQSQPRRICESGALKRTAETFSNVNVFNNALDRLDKISNSASLPVDDEFDLFGKQIACQLKQLPLHKALYIQQQFQSILTNERIALITGQPYVNNWTVSYVTSPSTGTAPFSPVPSTNPGPSNERASDILGEAMDFLHEQDC